jgi:hypothetical protein
MKSLSHFENFACFAALHRLASYPQATGGFTPLLTAHNTYEPPGCAAHSPIYTKSTLSPQPRPSSAHIQSP